MIWIVLNVFVVVAEVFMYYLVSTSFFKKRTTNAKDFIGFISLIIASIIVVSIFGGATVIKIGTLCFIYALWTKTSRNVTWISSLFVALFYNAYIYIADTCFVLVAAFCIKEQTEQILSTPQSFYLFTYLAKCLEIIIIIVFRRFGKMRLSNIPNMWQDWLRTAILPLSTLILCFIILKIYYLMPSLAYELLMCTIILLITNFVSAFIIEKLEEHQVVIRDNAILHQSLKKEQENLSLWSDAYRNQRKQTHDFQNHLLVLRGLVTQDNASGEACNYIDTLLHEEYDSTPRISTHRNVVDILMTQKYTLSQKYEIQFDFHLDDLSEFPLPDDALTIVLANLLDNAIGACSQIGDPKKRRIKLKMETTPDASFLYIENSTEKAVKIVDNHIVTSMDAPGLHGFGMQNIRSILDRYDTVYFFDYSAERQVFVFSAQLSPS